MLKIKKMEVSPDITPPRLSYTIPDGFWFDNAPEVIANGVIVLYTEEKDAEIEIKVFRLVEDSLENEMLAIIEVCAPEKQEGPFPVHMNGMDGLGVYCSKRENQYIMLLDISGYGMVDEDGVLQEKLEITITTDEDIDIKAVAERVGIKELLSGISIEKKYLCNSSDGNPSNAKRT